VREPNNYISEFGKLNAAYESGKYKYMSQINSSNDDIKAIKAGFQTIDQTISSVIGLPINYNAVVNFHAFQQAVDSVGGITVDVPETLYDPTMAWMNNWNSVLAKKGIQKMNGYHALIYSRSRETSSDFARGERQRAILLAIKDKALSAGTLSNPLKISDLLSTLGSNVRTDISLNDMQRIHQIVSKIPSSNIKSVDLDKPPNVLVTTGRVGSQSVVKPSAGLFDYSAIKTFVRTTLRDGYLAKENALVKVLNGTDSIGLAQNVSDELKSYGYRTAEPGNAPGNNHQSTMLVDLSDGRNKYTKHYLEQRFNVNAVTGLPIGVESGGASFVIIVGQDQAQVD
jgi:LCP family protein required for cell wall assembly